MHQPTRAAEVLVIEDNPLVQRGLVRALESAGYRVTAVGDALSGFAALEARVFDAILCDIQLPFVDGRRFYEQLVESHPSLSNRVIFVTAMVNDPVVRAFLERTGRPVVAKPFLLDELAAAVESVIRQPNVDEPILGLPNREREIARSLPDAYRAESGTPLQRVAAIVDRNWPSASEPDRRQLQQMLLTVLDAGTSGNVTDELRRQCEDIVMGWAVRQ